MDNNILAIFKIEKPKPHYELHFNKRVDFVTLDGKLIKSSKIIEVVE